jgi:asparagine synthase (glutamine-hydrolysing)
MCGIAGVLRGDRHASALLDALSHRGPDSQGSVELGACSLAVTRLAILDRSQRADQPMTYGDATIVLNGEIYNFADLRSQLTTCGWSFETSGDTEVLLKSLLQWGTNALARVQGMYAFLLWLADRQELWAARDRFGIKPLYWGPVDGEGVAFASEARALTELVGCKISRRGLSEFLHFGSPYSSTAFEGVAELSPGSISIWKADHSVEVLPTRPARSEEQPIADVLANSVRSHLVSDRPVALFLSGGFDSALIASQVAGLPEKPTAFTIDTGRNRDDVSAACRTAGHYGMTHQIVAYTPHQIGAQVERYMQAMDQPTIDGFNTLLVSNAVNAARYPVALSGLGGDEILGGYGYYKRGRFIDLARRPYLKLNVRARAGIDRVIASRTGRVAPQVASIFEAQTIPERYHAWRSVFTAREVERLTGLRPPHAPTLIWEDGGEDLRRDHRSLDFDVYLRSTLLRDSDLFSMACGVELRVPLLDSRLVDRTMTHFQYLDKSALAAELNDPYLAEVAARKKMAFRLPWSDWVMMLGSSTELFAEDDPWKGFVDPHEARRIMRDPLDGPIDRLLALLVLAGWLRGLDWPRRIERRPV